MKLDLQKFYQACNPSKTLAVENAEDRKYYIDFSSVRGGRIIEELKENITFFSPEGTTCELFTGHIGCGKSTELLRLKAELEQADFHVVYFESSQDLEMGDVDISDILLSVARRVSESLDSLEKLEIPEPQGLKKILQGAAKLLMTEVEVSAEASIPGIGKVSASTEGKFAAEAKIPGIGELKANEKEGVSVVALGIGKITAKAKNSPELRNKLREYLGHVDSVTSVSFSPDGKMIASGSADGVVIIWNRNGKKIKDFKAHEKKITSLGFSPDSQKLLSASEDKTLKLWSLKGKKIAIFKGHEDEITTFSFSPNGQKVISGSKDTTLKLWNLDGTEIKTFRGHKDSINSVNFSPDGKIIASVSNEMMKLWSLDGKEIKTLNDGGQIVSFSPDGQTIVVQNSVYITLRRRDGSLLKLLRFPYSPYSRSKSLVFSRDGQTIYITSFSRQIIYASILQIDTGNTFDFDLTGHRNTVTTVSISPDGKMLASGSEDKTVKLWSLESRKFQTSKRNDVNEVNEVSFSPNGQIVSSVNNSEVKLWERDGTLKITLPENKSKISFSADSQKLVSASQLNTLQLWQQDGTFIKSYQGKFLDGSFSLDGRTIAVVRNNNTVELSSSDGKLIKILSGHKDKVYQISFSPNGEIIATASEDKTIKLWRLDGTLITSLNDLNKVSNISFSPDEKTLVTASENKTIKFWHVNGKLITSLNGDIQNIGFSRNSKTLAILDSDNTVKFIGRDGKLIKSLKYDQEMSVNFSPDGEIIAINNSEPNEAEGTLELWRMDGTFLAKLQNKDKSPYIRVSGFTPDSQIIVSFNYYDNILYFWKRNGSLISIFNKTLKSLSHDYQTLVTVEGDNKLNLWKRDGTQIRTIQVKSEKVNLSNNDSFNVRFSPDGQILVIYTDFGNVELWRIDGTFLKTFPCLSDKSIEQFGDDTFCNKKPILSFSSDSQTLAIRTNNNKVQFWGINSKTKAEVKLLNTINGENNRFEKIETIPNSNKIAISWSYDVLKLWQLPEQSGKQPQLLKTLPGHKNWVNSLSISPKNGMIASASDDNTVKVWRRDGTLFYTFTGHKNKVNSVSFSPDGKLIASASDDKTVKVWQPDGKVIKSFEEHGNKVTSVSFSPDNKTIASASQDNTIKLWSVDSKNNKSLATLSGDEPITSVSFSPDGKMIASAGGTKVKLWSIDGTLLSTYDRFGSNDVSFSPDGKSIASGGDEISVWDFDLNQLLKRGCDVAHDYLKNNPKAESDRYLCDDIYNQK